jgi:hypothetical protein
MTAASAKPAGNKTKLTHVPPRSSARQTRSAGRAQNAEPKLLALLEHPQALRQGAKGKPLRRLP